MGNTAGFTATVRLLPDAEVGIFVLTMGTGEPVNYNCWDYAFEMLLGVEHDGARIISIWRRLHRTRASMNAVSMSTIYKVLVARPTGLRLISCSSITNMVIDTIDNNFETNHKEMLEAGQITIPRLVTILKGVLKDFPE